MKKIFTFLLLILSLLTFSQKNSIAEYKLIIHSDSLNKLPEQIKAMDEKAILNAVYVKPKLIFNDSTSLFYAEDVLATNDKYGIKAAKTYCNCSKPIYTNIKEQISLKNTSQGFLSQENEFLISDSLDKNWVLHNESKLINNYTCFKATLEKQVVNNAGIFKHTVTAWYCPEIPYAFGPKGYANLPGLIFELHEKNIMFGIEKLELKKMDIAIKKPTKGKLISLTDYVKHLENKVKELD
jgi:GLPGLI family protein